LFAFDAEARRKAPTTAARNVRRRKKARTLLDDVHSKIKGSAVRCITIQRTQARLANTRLRFEEAHPLRGASRLELSTQAVLKDLPGVVVVDHPRLRRSVFQQSLSGKIDKSSRRAKNTDIVAIRMTQVGA
jgi:hypothetical protein